MGDKIIDLNEEEEEEERETTNPMSSPLLLPCGLLLPNRIVKLPMEECLALFGGGSPTEAHSRLYELWARGGWGMVITGNVQINPSFLSTPWDLFVSRSPSSVDHQVWSSLVHRFNKAASSSSPSRSPFIVQISHPGRQSPLFCRSFFGERPPSASETRVNSKEGWLAGLFNGLMFRTAKEMTDEEVLEVVERFGEAAGFLESVGVDGVEVHGAHGYMIAQFLSPLTNLRPPTSRFALHPPSPSHPELELLRLLLLSIRKHTSRDFCVGIKLSCGDFVRGGLSEEEALEQVRRVREMRVRVGRDDEANGDQEGWDFVEISGGGYENPLFATTSGPNLPFLSFTRRLLSLPTSSSSSPNPPPPPILLSSSLRSLPSLIAALSPSPSPFSSSPNPTSTRAADLLGFARPSLLHPSLPLTHLLRNPPIPIPPHSIPNAKFWSWLLSGGGRVGLVGAGLGTIWWDWQMGRVGRGEEVKGEMGVWEGFRGEYGSWLGRWVAGGALVGLVFWWWGLMKSWL